MAHGTPDYGVTAGRATVYQLTDLGELAVRLGSPVSHDRRGDVIWWDDFEWGLNKWEPAFDGTGGSVALSTARSRNGRSSCLLTAGSDSLLTAEIDRRQALPSIARLGVEFSFANIGNFGYIELRCVARTTTGRNTFTVRWDDATNVLQYTDSTGGLVTFATGVNLAAVATLFHTLKMVFDVAATEYVRVILDSTQYDLSGIAGEQVVATTTPYLDLRIRLFGDAAQNDQAYIDDVILTQNEPA